MRILETFSFSSGSKETMIGFVVWKISTGVLHRDHVGEDDNVIDLIGRGQAHQLQPVGVIAATEDDGQKLAGLQAMDEKLLLLGFAGVADRVDDERDETRTLVVQGTRQRIRLIAMFARNRQDAVAR